jgi:small-conductance mechanosensitive channel
MPDHPLARLVTAQPLALLRAWAPLLIVVALCIAACFGLRRFFAQRIASGNSTRYQQQGIMALAGLFLLLALIIAAPIGDTLRGQLLSLFGIVVSATIALSSTTIMGNLIGGLMLRVVSNLRAGDFVRVGEHFGRITERGLLHVEIQTEDSDLTTLPNLMLVQQPFTVVRAGGTIISAEVSLGYDVSHVEIEKALLKAAADAGLEDGFVQTRNLGDFSVLYRLCGRLTDVRQIVTRRSRLRTAMLDALHSAGIEIVSPTFMNQRQIAPERQFIPEVRAHPGPQGDGHNAERVLFDKAERAALAERLSERLRDVRAKTDQLKEMQAALAKDDEQGRADLDKRIENLGRREARIAALIEEARAPDDW